MLYRAAHLGLAAARKAPTDDDRISCRHQALRLRWHASRLEMRRATQMTFLMQVDVGTEPSLNAQQSMLVVDITDPRSHRDVGDGRSHFRCNHMAASPVP